MNLKPESFQRRTGERVCEQPLEADFVSVIHSPVLTRYRLLLRPVLDGPLGKRENKSRAVPAAQSLTVQ